MDSELTEFLDRSEISEDGWNASGCDWRSLVAIREDHLQRTPTLQESAEFFAKFIQKIPRVHSVRWRVKDAQHLMAKIVRKKAEGIEKYRDVTVGNYHKIVTDLIGIRALHLFKDECIEIDARLRTLWQRIETPVVYIRDGDQGELTRKFEAEGFEVKSHPAGYRSVHYVIESRPVNESVFAELQVRTIFEEAWSEIDHRVRYPNFTQSELVAYFLAIFNRLSGSADEMGGFVRGLASTLQELESRIASANREKREALDAMEETIGEMEAAKKRDEESARQIKRLKAEVEKLKQSSLMDSLPKGRGLGLLGEISSLSSDAQASIEKIQTAFGSPSLDFAKLARIEMPILDFAKLAKIDVPKLDFGALNRSLAEIRSTNLEHLMKSLDSPSDSLRRLSEASLSQRPTIARVALSETPDETPPDPKKSSEPKNEEK